MEDQPRITILVKFATKDVGTATVYADGSIHMDIQPIPGNELGLQIYDLLEKHQIGHCSFAFELGDDRLRRKE